MRRSLFLRRRRTSATAPRSLPARNGGIYLVLARKAVTAAANGREGPEEDAAEPEKLRVRRACFVTLTKKGELRGCIGTLSPQEPLCQAVVRRARSAATEDTRFSPVRPTN